MENNKKIDILDPEYVFTHLDNKSFIVNLEEICDKLDIKIRKDLPIKMLGKSGAIYRKNGKTTIWINPADPPLRQRGTLAHELGHYARHFKNNDIDKRKEDDLTNFRFSEIWDAEEFEANQYAESLLMPRLLILRNFEVCYKKGRDNIIKCMANQFQVSRE